MRPEGNNPGVIHQIPVAVAAVTVIVHFPEGCKLEEPRTGPAGNGDRRLAKTNEPGGPRQLAGRSATQRRNVARAYHRAEMEKIWDGTKQTWEDIVPSDMETVAKSAQIPATPEELLVKTAGRRIVRFDGSGTTYNFKAYLSLLPGAPAGLWTTKPGRRRQSHMWPDTFNGEKKQPRKAQ